MYDGNHEAPILRTVGLKKYFGGVRALDGVDLEVNKGDIFGLIGPNGSGKTTMLNVLSGVLPPTDGQVFVGGFETTGLPADLIARKRVSRTFQNIRLFKDMSVLDNVKVGRHLKAGYGVLSTVFQLHRKAEAELERRAEQALEFVGMQDRRDRQANTLPYGEQRLIEIARAMAADPSLILLDEPLVGMPPVEIERLVQVFHQIIATGTTIILVEHTMRVMMKICHDIAVLNFGKVIAQGTPEEIRNNEDVITAYLGRGH